jgi:cell division protease FtsH
MKRKTQFQLWYIFVALWGILLLHEFIQQSRRVQQIPYSQFLAYLDQDRIEEVSITADRIRGKLKNPEKDQPKEFVAVRVEADLAAKLAERNVKFSGVIESTFLRDVLSWVVPILLFFMLWMFLVRRLIARQGMGGGFMAIGKSKAKIYVENQISVTFADVAGVDEAKEEMREIVGYLRDPRSYGRLGARLPKGVLLVGPPALARRCWRAPLPARPACPSSPSAARSSWRCSWAWAPPGCATSSSRRRPRRPASSSSTSWTPSVGRAGWDRRWAAATTRRSRR